MSPTPPDERRPRPDPALLIAWIVLAAVGVTALVLTAIDRTPDGVTPVALPAYTADPVPPPPSIAVRSSASAAVPPTASAAVPPTASTAVPSTVSTPVEACPASGLRTRASEVDGAMGLRAMGVDLINCGTRPYVVNGYPAIQVLGADGRPLAVEIIYGRSDITVLPSVDDPPRAVTIRPGESAATVLVWRRSMLDSDGGGTAYLMAPAAGQPPSTVTLPSAIDLGNDGRLGVGPWIHGTDR